MVNIQSGGAGAAQAATTVTNALSDWDKLTKADANAITSAADTLAKQDKALANKLLNTGK